jgi:hypothetical protein
MSDHYGTLAGADNYHAERLTAWTGSDADKTAALVRGSQYVDGIAQKPLKSGRWVCLFTGNKADGRAQVLQWPRRDAYDNDGSDIGVTEVPIEVEHATYEAALRELIAPGSLSPDYVPASRVKREKVDVIETEYADAPASNGLPSANPSRPVVTVVLELLAPVMRAGGGDIGLLVV